MEELTNQMVSEIVVECRGLPKFHVKKENGELMKRIIQMCQSYGLDVKVY